MMTCNRDDSQRFLARLMTNDEVSVFENHLEACADCRERLEQSAGPESIWRSARDLLVHDLTRVDGSRSTAAIAAEHLPPEFELLPACTSSVVLSFLAPTDDPAMAGRIGAYEISGIVGRGSTGIVLKGFDRSLNRNVAIKVLDPAMADVGAARVRFSREARAMAAIAHEHLVPVYEVNEHAGLPFFVMEYVPGGSLERRLRAAGPLDAVSVVRIGLQVAQALAAAHAQGLVHRDIKPGNILLDRGTERVRVVDFGLVRVANDVSCTRSGIITGTPQYMAPEQVRAETCDGRSDLFSLGAVMYALATGHPPFRAETLYGVMQRIVHDAPRSIREQIPSFPEWLEQFIERMMAKERGQRFESAGEVAEILERQLAHMLSPNAALPPPRAWIRRRATASVPAPRRRSLIGGGLLGALAVAAGLSYWQFKAPLIETDKMESDQVPVAVASNEAVESNEPELRPPIPDWGADGTKQLQAAANTLESRWRPSWSVSGPDSWDVQVGLLRRSLSQLSADPDSSRSSPSSATNP